MTDNTQKAQGSGAGEALAEIEWIGSLAKKSVETASECEGIDKAIALIAAALSQPPEASDRDKEYHALLVALLGMVKDEGGDLVAALQAACIDVKSRPPEASEVEAVAYASPEQMAAMGDPIGDMAGAYIPLRKTPAGKFTMPLYAHPPKASPMRELQAMGQEFDAKAEVSAALAGEMLKAALLEEGGDAYMRNEDTPSHFLIDGIVDLDAVAKAIAQPAPDPGYTIIPDESYFGSTAPEQK